MEKRKQFITSKVIEGVRVSAYEMLNETEFFISYEYTIGKCKVIHEMLSRNAFNTLDLKDLIESVKTTKNRKSVTKPKPLKG